MKTKLKELSRENLQKVILEISGLFTKEQYQRLQAVVEATAAEDNEPENFPVPFGFRIKGNPRGYTNMDNSELSRNIMGITDIMS